MRRHGRSCRVDGLQIAELPVRHVARGREGGAALIGRSQVVRGWQAEIAGKVCDGVTLREDRLGVLDPGDREVE